MRRELKLGLILAILIAFVACSLAVLTRPAEAEAVEHEHAMERPHFIYSYWTGDHIEGFAEVPESYSPCFVRLTIFRPDDTYSVVVLPIGPEGEFAIWYTFPCEQLSMMIVDRAVSFPGCTFVVYDSMAFPTFRPVEF